MSLNVRTPRLSRSGVTTASSQPETPACFRGEPALASVPVRLVQQSDDGTGHSTPSELALGSLRHPELRLRSPLILDVQREGDQVVVSHEQLGEVGRGPYLTAAVEDFQRAVGRRYLSLQSEQARLDPERARLWQTLQQWIEERR